MEEPSETGDASVSIAASLMSVTDESFAFAYSEAGSNDYTSPARDHPLQGAMGDLSLSSIGPVGPGTPLDQDSVLSPDRELKPDVLMSTFNTKGREQDGQVGNDLSISIGPLTGFQRHVGDSSIRGKIEELDRKCWTTGRMVDGWAQTETLQCLRCDELKNGFDAKLLELAEEFQQQYAAQFRMMDEHNAAAEEAQKQNQDLMDQLVAADSQLRANRVFLNQQAVEREQEREESLQQLQALRNVLAEKERECERSKAFTAQMALELQQSQDALKEKDTQIQRSATVQVRLEQQLEQVRESRSNLDEENEALQRVVAVRDKLLEAQAEQIEALKSELELQLQLLHQSESRASYDADRRRGEQQQQQQQQQRRDADLSPDSLEASTVAGDLPSLFHELQHVLGHLMRRVERSTRVLENIQSAGALASPRSPRSHVTPATSTEDISVKDRTRNETSIGNLRELSPSPPPPSIQPEALLGSLQQLDTKIATLFRIEEAACKRISDLETELRRAGQSAKQSSSRTTALEEKEKQHEKLLLEVEAEKHELQLEHTELLKRISSLENRLEEQRRSTALGVTQNPYGERLRELADENEHLAQTIHQKDESLYQMKSQVSQLQQRIGVLMARVASPRDCDSPASERLRHDVQQQTPMERSLSWNKLNVPSSPQRVQSPSSPLAHLPHLKEVPQAVHFELDELRSKLAESQQQGQALCDRIDELRKQLERCSGFERQAGDLSDQLERQRQRLEEREQQCQALERVERELRQQVEDLEQRQRQNGDESQRQQCLELEQRLHDTVEWLKDRETRCQDLERVERELRDQLERAIQELEALKQVEHENERIKESQKCHELENFKEQLNDREARCNTLELAERELRDRLEQKSRELEDLKQLQRQNEEAMQLQQCHELENLKGQLNDREARCGALEQLGRELRGQLEQTSQELEDLKKLELRNELSKERQRCHELENLKEQLKDREARCGALEQLERELSVQLEHANRELENLKELDRQNRGGSKELQQRCDDLQRLELELRHRLEQQEGRSRDAGSRQEGELPRRDAAEQTLLDDDLTAIRDELAGRAAAFQAEVLAHQATRQALEQLRQRHAALAQDHQNGRQQVSQLQRQLEHADRCKAQVEEMLQQLRREVDLLKELQDERRAATPSRQSPAVVTEGPAAPPDLLAPSFVELLGSCNGSSSSSSRCSSASDGASISSSLVRDSAVSRLVAARRESTLDFSLPESMRGKKTLRSVQQQSQQLLQLLQQRHVDVVRDGGDGPAAAAAAAAAEKRQRLRLDSHRDELDDTLKAQEPTDERHDRQSARKIQLLETQLALERLLLKEQRAANLVQQEQIMELLSEQRQLLQPLPVVEKQEPVKRISKTAFQYRNLKLESQRKSLVYQKKFLASVVHEFDLTCRCRTSQTSAAKKRFKCVVWAVVSIQRMLFIRRQWNHRRKLLEREA